MVRCQYGHKKIKQDNCPRLSQSQSTAPCPVTYVFICQSCMKLPINAVLQSLHLHFLGGCSVVQPQLKTTFSSKIIRFTNDKWLDSLTNTYQIESANSLLYINELIFPTVEPPLHWSSAAQSQSCCSRWSSHILFPPSWSPACAAPSSQTVGGDCSVLEPSGRFVGERQHSSSRIASVAAELLAATQHSSHSSSVCRCCRRTTRIAGEGAAAAVARSSVALHSCGQQLLFQQLLILFCHGDSHVVTKIFPISTGLKPCGLWGWTHGLGKCWPWPLG